jgi:putative hydrolase of the HAD superfamily
MSDTKSLLLLDFGAVISRTIFETHSHTERVLGLSPGSLTWLGPVDPDTDPLWRDMLADKISERNYWEIRAEEVGQMVGESGWSPAVLLRKAREGMNADDITRPEAVALARAAKKGGKRVGILSNELALFFGANFRSELPFFALMDGVVDASDGGPMKPAPQAYQRGLDTFGTGADQVVFVDDQPRNVTGAEDMGISSVAFDVSDPEGSFRQAARLLAIQDIFENELARKPDRDPVIKISSG